MAGRRRHGDDGGIGEGEEGGMVACIHDGFMVFGNSGIRIPSGAVEAVDDVVVRAFERCRADCYDRVVEEDKMVD